MRLALRELRRTPGRFLVATITISLIAILLMFLGALLDGLLQLSTGAYQAQRGQLIVMTTDSKGVLSASSIDADARADVVAAVEEVTGETVPDQADADAAGPAVAGYGETALGARLDGGDERELVAMRMRGYELAPAGLPAQPPAAGEVWADPDLASSFEVGDVLLLGPGRAEVTIVGFLEQGDTPSLGGIWGSMETWREVTGSARPGVELPADFTQALIVAYGGEDASDEQVEALAEAIGVANGDLRAYTIEQAGEAIPGVDAQRVTFNQIIAITTAIALVVIALFFALLTAERVGLYGVLKAVGARSSALFAGVASQAITLTLIATVVGLAMMAGAFFGIPPGTMPFAITWQRLASSVGLLLLAAILGSAFSLRSVLRIDPAEAIGGN